MLSSNHSIPHHFWWSSHCCCFLTPWKCTRLWPWISALSSVLSWLGLLVVKPEQAEAFEGHIVGPPAGSRAWSHTRKSLITENRTRRLLLSVSVMFCRSVEVLQFVSRIFILYYEQDQMIELMDLIKYFYSTFIHYFLIKPVEYFYMFISQYTFTVQAVSICKEEYLTPSIIFNVKMIAGPNLKNLILYLNDTKLFFFVFWVK